MAVDGSDVSRWFGEYLVAFAACGRGEADTASLLEYYGVPLLVSTGDGFFALTTGDQVVAVLQQQVDGMRAAAYSRSEVLDSEVTVFNATSALYQGTFSRQRGDGTEINRLTASYLVTDGTEGRRISVLAVHTPGVHIRSSVLRRSNAGPISALLPTATALDADLLNTKA